jgi:hypothetical protein
MVLVGVTLVACASEIPSAAAARSDDDSKNVPGGAYGWAQNHAELSARRATALAEIGEAKRAIVSGGDDCSETCPLLVTLRTGVDHLCALREGQDDAARCKEARTDFTATETRVRKSCDACKPARLDDDVDAAL